VAGWLLLSAGRAAEARQVVELETILRHARSQQAYQPATAAELIRCEELFERTLLGPEVRELAADWLEMGWRLFPLAGSDGKLWIVMERADRQRGWGVYAFRTQPLRGVILQAPHSDTDRFTGNVALRLFADGNFKAAAWNTVPRERIDVAHSVDHPFTAFTRATVKADPNVCVVQIHGFSPERRQSLAGKTADLIISNGSYSPDRTTRCFATMLQSEFPYGRVQLFPMSVGELGATTNVQGDVLHRSGSSARFLHLEFSQSLRLRLVNDRQARQAILKRLSDCAD
jgi:hypothetical protein